MSSTTEEYKYNNPTISNDNNLLEQALRHENIGKLISNCQNTSQRSPSSATYHFNFENKKISVNIAEFSTSGCVALSYEIEPYIVNTESMEELMAGIEKIQQKFPPVIWNKYDYKLVSPILSVGINSDSYYYREDSEDEEDI